jgi:hypothetical protein
MKKLLFLLILFPMLSFGQINSCVHVDSIYSTAKFKEMGNRDIRFGIKQMAEDILSEKYCINESSPDVDIEVFFFGLPRTTVRIVGVEKTNQITQVGIRIYYNGSKYEAYGESDTEIRTIMLEIAEGQMPFSKMTISNAIKKALVSCVSQMP